MQWLTRGVIFQHGHCLMLHRTCLMLSISMTLLHTCTPDTNVYIVISTRMTKDSVFCLVNVLFFVTYWNIYKYCTNSEVTHKSCACFQHANTTKHSSWSGILMLKASTGLMRLNYLPVGCILRTIYGLMSICWSILNYVDFILTSKSISIFLNISQSNLAFLSHSINTGCKNLAPLSTRGRVC